MAVYREMLVEDPLDRRAHQQLLMAAAATGEAAQLRIAWEEISAALDGDVDSDLAAMHDRPSRESTRDFASGVRNGYRAANRGAGTRTENLQLGLDRDDLARSHSAG